MDDSSEEPSSGAELNVVVIGSAGVGKSALTLRCITGNFFTEYDPTLLDSYRKVLTVDGRTQVLNILDTAGAEEFSSLTDSWYREAEVFIAVYAVNSTDSYTQMDRVFRGLKRSKEDRLGECVVVIAANKCDLTDYCVVSEAQRMDLQKRVKADGFGTVAGMQTSAKDNVGVDQLFETAVRELRRLRGDTDDGESQKCKCSLL